MLIHSNNKCNYQLEIFAKPFCLILLHYTKRFWLIKKKVVRNVAMCQMWPHSLYVINKIHLHYLLKPFPSLRVLGVLLVSVWMSPTKPAWDSSHIPSNWKQSTGFHFFLYESLHYSGTFILFVITWTFRNELFVTLNQQSILGYENLEILYLTLISRGALTQITCHYCVLSYSVNADMQQLSAKTPFIHGTH